MRNNRRLQVLSGLLVVVAIVAVIFIRFFGTPQKPPPSAPGYYSGPMKSKGDPTIFGNEEGQRVAAPPGATTKPASPKDGSN